MTYVIKDSSNKVVALCSRKEDAEAIAQTKLDKENGPYKIEKQ